MHTDAITDEATQALPPRRRLVWLTTVVATSAWSGLLLQLYLTLSSAVAQGRGLGGGLVEYLGYFTILTNLLVALAVTLPFLAAGSAAGGFFSRAGLNTSLAAAISIVALAYSLLLRHTWDPQGLWLVADTLLHDVTPPLFLAYWWFCVPKASLQWRRMAVWFLYPLCYLTYVMLRGAWLGSYPYPFIDATALGLAAALVNAFGILFGYAVVAALLMMLGQWQARGRRQGR